jgi:hypothetical protein
MGHQHDKFESFMTFFSRHFVREYVSYPIPLNDHWVQVFPSLTQDSISLAPQSLYNHSRRQHKVSVDVSGSLPLLLVLLGLDFLSSNTFVTSIGHRFADPCQNCQNLQHRHHRNQPDEKL